MATAIPQKPSTACLFIKVPIELHQQIASNLDNDEDLKLYRILCRVSAQAIDADGCSFWRRRFLHVFEMPGWQSSGHRLADNEKFRDAYKKRKHTLQQSVVFKKGLNVKEKACLEMARDLIVESMREGTTTDASKNMRIILNFIEQTNILQIVGADFFGKKLPKAKASLSTTQLLYTLQCVLAPSLFSFNPKLINMHSGFSDAQQLAYSSDSEAPIFGGVNGLDVNMPWLLANIQFWRHHLLRRDEGTLEHDYAQLDESERPRWWDSQLSQEMKKLGCHWKGSYAFVDRDTIKQIRAGAGHENPIMDELNGEQDSDAFQDLRLQLVDPNTAGPWPNSFEKHLKSLKSPVNRARTRAQRHHSSFAPVEELVLNSLRFDGSGYDNYEDFCASGWLNPLPAQHGVPGWQRMTMMKFFVDESTGAIDHEALWAYEGVVLPGGQIMLGRWWCPSDGYGDEMYSGPFILWCLDDGPEMVKAEKEMEALERGQEIVRDVVNGGA